MLSGTANAACGMQKAKAVKSALHLGILRRMKIDGRCKIELHEGAINLELRREVATPVPIYQASLVLLALRARNERGRIEM